MLDELRQLRQQLEIESQHEGSSELATIKRPAHAREESRGVGTVRDKRKPKFEISSHKPGLVTTIVAFFVLTGLIVVIYRFIDRRVAPRRPSLPFLRSKMSSLTTTGNVSRAAISPDGKYVAYVTDEFGEQSLWVRQVATTVNRNIITASERWLTGVTF